MKAIILYTLLIFMTLGCNGTKNLKGENAMSVSLNHQSEARNVKLTLHPSFYIMEIQGEAYQYDLDSAKWSELNEILKKVKVENLANYTAPEVGGRFVEKELKSQITIQNNEGEFASQIFFNSNVPEELRELYLYLDSYFPVN